MSANAVNFKNMEIESKSGSKIRLEEGSETLDFGRELGFISSDRAISRHHISFKLHEDRTRVYFEVKGKNPVWVRDRRNDEIRVYKRSEGGEIKNGDSFCVASKNPVWFNVKRIASENEDDSESKSELSLDEAFAETSGIEYDEVETGDISLIDPVKGAFVTVVSVGKITLCRHVINICGFHLGFLIAVCNRIRHPDLQYHNAHINHPFRKL